MIVSYYNQLGMEWNGIIRLERRCFEIFFFFLRILKRYFYPYLYKCIIFITILIILNTTDVSPRVFLTSLRFTISMLPHYRHYLYGIKSTYTSRSVSLFFFAPFFFLFFFYRKRQGEKEGSKDSRRRNLVSEQPPTVVEI